MTATADSWWDPSSLNPLNGLDSDLNKDFKSLNKGLSSDFKGIDNQLKDVNETLTTDLGGLDTEIKQLDTDINSKFGLLQKDVADIKKWLLGAVNTAEKDAKKQLSDAERAAELELARTKKDFAFLIGAVSLVVYLNSETSIFFTAAALGLALSLYLVIG